MHWPCVRFTLLLLTLLTTLVGTAHADIVRAFEPRASFDQRGDIQLVGNTLLTCTGTGCAAIQDGTNTGSNAHNGNRNMVYVNVDPIAGFPNSSSADLVIPAGATIQFAGLYWGARAAQTSTTRGTVRFRVPGTPGYHEITAEDLDTVPNQWTTAASHPYQGMADVTALVSAAGSGTYTVADLTANNGNGGTLGYYGGWGLVVIYQDNNAPFRRLMVYDGAAEVDNSNNVDITVEGLLTPLSGTFETYLGALVWEGDLSYAGDQFRLNGTQLSDALNPANNFWNSTITRLGQHITNKNPHYINQLAVDINYVDASGILANGADSATLTFSTNMDAYAPHAVAFAVELHAPDLITSLDIDGVDINGGLLLPGDEIEYTITFENTGLDAATNVVLESPLPVGVSIVPGSLEIISNATGAPVGPQTDAVGDDLAEVDGNNIRFRAGTGAGTTEGGHMPIGEGASLRFRVSVDNTPAMVGETLTSMVFVTYNSETLGTEYNASGTVSLNLSVASAPDIEDELELEITDVSVGTPTTVGLGGELTYTFTIANNGSINVSDLSLDIDLPVTGVSCVQSSLAASAQTTCTATVTLTQAMLDDEEISVTASAVANGPLGQFSSSSVTTTTPLDLPPVLLSIARFAPMDEITNLDPVGFVVTFSEDVVNVDATDFMPVGGGAGSASILSVAVQGGNNSYLVTVTGISNANGTLGLALSPANDIEDTTGNPLADLLPTGINQTYTLDNTPPAVPAITGISEDTGISNSDGITSDNTLVFQGTGEAGSLITVYLDGASLGTVVVDGSGNWSLDHSATTLADGSYLVTATAEDALGNTSDLSDGFTVVVDTVAPTPNLDQDGAELNDNTPTLTGTTEPGASVVVTIDGETYTTTADETTGVWTVTVTEELTDGIHTVGVAITDLAGNSDSGNFTVSIDGEPPVVESIQRHTPTEEITSADTVTFLVSFDEEVFGVDATDFVLTGAGAAGAIISNLTPQAGGTQYLVEISGIDNADGALGLSISATADILDSHGNALTPAVPPINEGYVLDNTAPALDVAVIEDDTLTLHFDETLDNASVPSAGDFTVMVDGDLATVTGVSIVDDTVVLTLDESVSSNASVTISYTPGTNPIQDLAGNPADSFSGEPVTNDTADTIPPRLDNITRHDPVDALTNANSVTFLVTFDEDVTNVAVGSFEATGAGATTATIDNVTALSGNSYTVTVGGIDEANGELGLMLSGSQSIEDLAGNLLVDPSVLGNSETYTLDNTPPAVPLITGISDDTGISDSDGITSDNTLIFHGTGEPDSDITVYLDGVSLGTVVVDGSGNWSLNHTATVLTDGTYTITATAEDELGNTSDLSDGFTVVVDTVAPTPTLDQDGAELNDSTPTLTGTTEPGATVVVTIDGETYTTTADETTGAWTVTVTEELADGIHTVDVAITDLAGNSDSGSFTLSIDGEPPVVESIQRHTPTEEITSADTVTFLVSFDEEVFGVDATDFVLTGTAAAGAIISNLIAQAGGTQYLVEISGIDNADGALGLAISPTADILDSHGNALTPAVPPISEGYVLDNTAPTLDAAVIEDDTLTLHFDETLDNTSVPAAGDFTVMVDGSPATVTGVSIVDDTVVLTLEDGISSNASVTVGYTPGTNPIVDLAGNPADSFSGEPVTNDTADNVPPRLDNITRHDPVDALTNANSVTFLVTFDEDVTNVAIGSFEATGAGATTATIDNVTALSGNSYTVTVGGIDEANGELGLMLSSMQNIEDLAGNLLVDSGVLGNSETYTLDNTPPAVPAITGISEDTGSSDEDGITSDNTLVFHGTGEPDSLITVYLDDVAIGTVVVDGDGDWSLDHTATVLTDGTYTVTATAEDELGNTSELSDDFTVVIVTQVDEPTLDQDGSTLENGTLTGTTSPHAEVCVAINSEEVACVTADENGDWTLELDELGVGTHDLDITVTDPAGNEDSGSFTVTVSTPSTPLITGISADTGVSNNDGITSDHTPTIHGTAQAGHTVAIYRDGAQIGTALVDIDGQWSLPHSGLPLDDGSYLITAIAEDPLGNVSILSLPFGLTIDTETSVPTLNQDGETHDATPTLTGDAEPGAEITVTIGGDTWTTSADNDGHWSVEIVDGLPNGDYGVTVEATDTAGNTASGDYTLSIDEALTVLRRVERDAPLQRETNATQVSFLLVFSGPVAGVDATDLALTGAVAGDILIHQVTPLGINGDGEDLYRVTLNVSNSPNGELGLALAAGQSIVDQYSNPLGNTTPGVNEDYLLDNLAPTLTEASVVGSSLALTYNESLDDGSVPDAGDFTVIVDGQEVPVTSVSISGNGVTLTLETPVSPGAQVHVSYAPGTSAIQDLAGNGTSSLSGQGVTNLTLRAIETGLRGVGGSGAPVLLLMLALCGALRRRATWLGLLASIGLLSTSVSAADHYPYAGAGLGQSRLAPDTDNTGYRIDDKTDTALGLFVGYQWHPHWSAELSWHDLGAAELEPTLPGLDPIDVDYRFLGLSGIGYLKGFDWDARGWDLFGRLGIGTLDTSGNGGVSVDQDKDWQLFFGAGVEYRFARGWATRLQATSFDKDASVVTLDVLKRFGRRPPPPPLDSDGDGDGVIDELDQCPDTPRGVEVDEVGCPLDSDRDGVPDYLDQCPNTPRGVKVDEVGCPLDSDGDGVPDYRDACPGTPAGAVVDAQGCEEAFALEVRNILFASNSAELTAAGLEAVGRVATYLGASDTRLLIVAHTDSQGAAAYNQQLSERRAESVVNALVGHGIDPARLQSQGKGESAPIADNSTAEGRQQNRRVEFIIIEDEEE
ncbi:MAG: Ig-like domain-containing protein [Alcanivorax sp.]|nr:Ig-like domain-containing protein [Alcanivorax sp.]